MQHMHAGQAIYIYNYISPCNKTISYTVAIIVTLNILLEWSEILLGARKLRLCF